MNKEKLMEMSINRHEWEAVKSIVSRLSDIDKDEAIRSGLKKGGERLKRGGMVRLRHRMKSGQTGKTGNLLRSFIVRVKKRVPGVLAGFKQGKNGGNHAHLVDMGTIERMRKQKSRKRGGRGGRTGSASANYFWSETKTADMNKAVAAMEEGIAGFVNKIRNRI